MMSKKPDFCPEQIVFTFGVLSDWHVKLNPEPERDTRAKLSSALTQLQTLALREDPHGLALLVAAGDLTHDGKAEEIELLRETMTSVFPFDRSAFIYVAGNHDRHNPACNEEYHRVFGPLVEGMYDAHSAAPDGIFGGNRHYTVGGRHFITLDPGKYSKTEPNIFTESTKLWLDETLARITAEEPNAYVYVITHLLIQDTCYGSSRGFFYATADVTSILKKYPQVVTFGGHLHYPLNDERAIMQTDFTSLETATLSDMLIDGFDCANVRKGTKVVNNRAFAQGLLVQVDAGGNLRVKRLDLWRGAEIGEPWLLDAPKADRSHLGRYTAARGHDGRRPMLTGQVNVAFSEFEEGIQGLRLTLDAATLPGGWVRKYAVTVTDRASGETVLEMRYMSDFYRYPTPESVPQRIEIPVPGVARGAYAVSVTALDCWERESEPIFGEIDG